MGNSTKATSLITTDMATYLANVQPLRFASYVYDTETGLYYLSQRYYDPETMQFLTKDLEKADGEESGYQYCSCDPVNSVDPSGAWADTYHYKLTLKVERKLGIRDAYAKLIAWASKMVDTWYSPLDPRKWYIHFNMSLNIEKIKTLATGGWRYQTSDSRVGFANKKLKEAERYYLSGEKRRAAISLGEGIHAIQDIFAHGDYNPDDHVFDDACHIVPYTIPTLVKSRRLELYSTLDDPNFKPWRVDKAEFYTNRYLKRFKFIEYFLIKDIVFKS